MKADIDFKSPYERLGGAEGVRALVERFYDLVDTEPVAAPLRQMHLRGFGLGRARAEQFAFMSGFLGGPKLYFEQHRHANVKDMHAHLVIDGAARDAWLFCMKKALADCQAEPQLAEALMQSFTRVASMLVNSEPAGN